MKSNAIIKMKLKKAQAFLDQGDLSQARDAYQAILKKAPKNPDIALALAVINRKLGNFTETENIAKNTIKTAPNNAYAYHVLASAQQCMSQYDNAVENYNKALTLDQKAPETHYFLGNLYREINSLEKSAHHFREALTLNPNYFEAMNNLGAVLISLHKVSEAIEVLTKAYELNPNSIQVLCNLGELYLLENNLTSAKEFAKKSLRIKPDFLDAHRLLGSIYTKTGEYTLAINHFQSALKTNPDDINLIGSIASLLEKRGEFDEALKMIQPHLNNETTDSAILLTYSAISRTNNTQKEAIDLIEKALLTDKINDISKIILHSDLGKQYDAMKEFSNAFNHYKAANNIERKLNTEYLEKISSTTTTQAIIDKWKTSFNKSFWSELDGSGVDSEQPIFIVGLPRSGTTLVEQILASHPDVYGAGELPDISEIANSLKFNSYMSASPELLKKISRNDLARSASKYLQHISSLSDNARKVVNKMPTDFWHLGLISQLFPKAHIIHMIRDPRDICLSIYFQRFGSHMTFTTDLKELGEYYLSYKAIMSYWHSALTTKILDVRYEDLVDDQEAITRKILDYCNLEWNEDCLNFHQTKRDVNTPSYDQVRKPIYKRSVARWKNYESQIQPLLEVLEAHIE